jgi:hypothetical protein
VEKEYEIVILSDGRKVKVVETTGLDEMIAVKVASGQADENNQMSAAVGSAMQLRMVMIAFSIQEIDGAQVKRPTKLLDVQAFMGQFTSRQLAKIGKAYSRLNDDIEGEDPATESEN